MTDDRTAKDALDYHRRHPPGKLAVGVPARIREPRAHPERDAAPKPEASS